MLAEIERQKMKIEELMQERNLLESKNSVADEINTLMSSLNSVREENSQYEEEVRSLQSEMRSTREELYRYQDQVAHWKERAEKAENSSEVLSQRYIFVN